LSLKSDFAITQHLNFIFPWRSYQAKFLKEFDTHIDDDHLHVIAPPGSGKTVLGLEMIRRINRKTLVLCPTLTIRNQWNDRLQNCFLKDAEAVACSYNLKEPETLTFSTYQSLHALFKNEMDSSAAALIDFFKDQNIGHIVLDEAHHLKNEWWFPLFELKKLENCIYTSLTATPPYDSSPRELRNYFDLCGPVDVEITVPELVKEKNLCPHQDFIHFSQPSQERIKYIQEYREKLRHFVNALTVNSAFIDLVKRHRFYSKTEQFLPEIYENAERYSALIIFLNASGETITKEKLEVLGLDEKEQEHIPNFSYEWVEVLLQYYLIENREQYLEDEAVLANLEKELRRVGGLDQKRVNLIGEQRLYKSLSQSITKLNSIRDIAKAEQEALGESLRAVILSDYIRKEFLDLAPSQISTINKLGVIPIFQHLRFNGVAEKDIAVLTGSLIIVHSSIIEVLRPLLAEDELTWEQLERSSYLILKPRSASKTKLIGVLTNLFEDGFIKILIGTKSLLGEGWDCPAINTLILASFVGSFVMSNQMRGRAIRVSAKSPEKVASIWHLACLDPTSEGGGADYELLQRRFEAFCGVSLTGTPVIENGSDRLDLDVKAHNISELNREMLHLAKDRKEVNERWEQAMASGSIMVNELKLNFDDNKAFAIKRKVAYNSTVKYAVVEVVLVLTVILPELFLSYLRVLIAKGIVHFIVAVAAALSISLLPKLYKATRLYMFYGRIDKEIESIARVVFNTMVKIKHIHTNSSQIKIVIEEPKAGILNCFLKGATEKEEKLFIKYLQEVLAPIDNPRYIISQANWFREKLGFSSYFAVPEIFAQRKKEASVFYENWKLLLGKSALIFTRNLEGRKLLLKARFNELKKDRNVKTKQATIWK